MKRLLWYLLLCTISTVLFAYALYKKKDSKLIVLYFLMAGITYFIEYFVLVLFRGYEYSPGILKDRYFDNIIGAVVSDAFTVPMITTFSTAFKFNYKKRLAVAIFIIISEIISIKIKAYQQHWWNYYFTFIGVNVYLYYGQKVLLMLHKPINKIFRFITLYFTNIVIQASAVFVLVAFLKMYFYKVYWFENLTRGHIAFATLYIIFVTGIFTASIVLDFNYFWKGVVVMIPLAIDVVLIKMNILYLSEKWNLISFLLLRILILTYMILFNRYLIGKVIDKELSHKI